MHAFLALLLLAQTPSVPTLNGTITGVVRMGGKPTAGIRVAAVVPPGGGELMPSAMLSLGETDSEGRYRLEGVPPGRYYISAGRVDLPTYYPGSTTLSEGTVITLAPGATLSDMDFVLRNESLGRGGFVSMVAGVMTASGLSIPVNLQVEGGGKIPVFQNGIYPVIRATRASGSARSKSRSVNRFFDYRFLWVRAQTNTASACMTSRNIPSRPSPSVQRIFRRSH
jgi:hypothetical protein